MTKSKSTQSTNSFSEKQLQIFKFPYGKQKIMIADGAIRSGKTVASMLSFVLWAMSKFNGQAFGIASKTVRTAERNLIKPLLEIKYLKQHFQITFKRSLGLLELTRGNKTNTFYIYGGKDEASFSAIQGSTLAGLFLDEVVLMPRSFVDMAMSRCSVSGSRIFCTCNPDDPNHWFKKDFIDQRELKNILYLKFEMNDNPSLDEETKRTYYESYVGVFFKRFIIGEWVKAEGIIYETFANNPERYIKHKSDIPEIMNKINVIRIGVDFGGNKSKHSFTATGITYDFKYVVVLRSKRVKGLLDPTQLDEEYYQFVSGIERDYEQATLTRADNAEPVLIRGLANRILNSKLRNTVKGAFKKPILGRILTTNRLCTQERLIILKGENLDLEDALKGAVWNEKVANERLDDGTTDIDSLDSFEYSWEEFSDKLNAVG